MHALHSKKIRNCLLYMHNISSECTENMLYVAGSRIGISKSRKNPGTVLQRVFPVPPLEGWVYEGKGY